MSVLDDIAVIGLKTGPDLINCSRCSGSVFHLPVITVWLVICVQ